jgi:hypothetical protein
MPQRLTLVSLEVTDSQESDAPALDRIRLIVALDGFPVRTVALDIPTISGQAPRRSLGDRENVDDDGNPFVFWSFADLTVYEVDLGGLQAGLDWDTDQWVQTVRLDHRNVSELTVGRTSQVTFLLPGRSDTGYTLTFSMTNHPVVEDRALKDRIQDIRRRSEFLDDSETFGNLDADKGDCQWICAIDGGGLRGIFPLRMLEQLEAYYRRPAFQIFDMFAGTSTGSLVSSALATGMTVEQVIGVYSDSRIRNRIFRSNAEGQHHAFRYFDLKRTSAEGRNVTNLNDAMYGAYVADLVESQTGFVNRLINSVAEQLMVPRYRKSGMKEVLWQLLSRTDQGRLRPLRLRDGGKDGVTKDILVTAWDLYRNEATLFSAFHHPTRRPVTGSVGRVARSVARMAGPPDLRPDTHRTEEVDVVTGQYRDILLKDAVEASASAPVYFAPRARFSDGGIGPYNNPSFIAALEALGSTTIDPVGDPPLLTPKYTSYSEAGDRPSGTVVWSFGTAYRDTGPDAEADTANLIGGSLSLNNRTDTALFWLETVLDSLMFGASEEQVFLCREVLKDQIKYLRLNLGLSGATLDDLNVPGDRAQTLSAIRLDAVDQVDFDTMDEVAKRFALQARDRGFGFTEGGYELPERRLDAAGRRTYTTFVADELAEFE